MGEGVITTPIRENCRSRPIEYKKPHNNADGLSEFNWCRIQLCYFGTSGHFLKQEQWERWLAKRKLVSGSKHQGRFCRLEVRWYHPR